MSTEQPPIRKLRVEAEREGMDRFVKLVVDRTEHLIGSGLAERAVVEIESAVSRSPDVPRLQIYRALAHVAAGRSREAKSFVARLAEQMLAGALPVSRDKEVARMMDLLERRVAALHEIIAVDIAETMGKGEPAAGHTAYVQVPVVPSASPAEAPPPKKHD
jgi:hypothetical protein